MALSSLSVFLLTVVLCTLFSATTSISLRPLGQFPVYSVAFLKLGRFDSSSPLSLLATGFGVFAGDNLFYIPIDLTSINTTQPTSLTTSITWPNDPDFVPPNTIPGSEQLVVVGSGFLVPTKDTGTITIVDLANQNQISVISESLSGWFYHRIRWIDLDGDGLKDIITARATKPLFGTAKGELVWYKQPASGALSDPWKLTSIANGPDFLFELVDLNGDGVYEVAAAEFFGMKLTLTYSSNGNWSDHSSIKQIVVDPNIKSGFDVHVLDVNGDGREDLVATNHEGDGTGSVFGYEIPDDWRTGVWVKHVLASGFPVNQPGLNQASPGAPIPFYPTTSQTTGRMWIALGGDGSQCAYEMRPVSASGWDYTITTIVNVGATVGQLTVGDVDGDGYVEVFVPAYDSGIIYVYTYAP